MDIRLSSYRPVTVQSFPRSGSLPASTTVQNAASSGPVGAIQGIPSSTSGGTNQQAQRQVADTFDGKGRIVDIYA